MPFEDAIQLSESIEYPDGKNAITIEGTGDEGGVASFAKVSLTVTPDSLVADGINFFTCTATVEDRTNPTSTVVSLRTEETTAETRLSVRTNMLIKTFVGLWKNVGGVHGTDFTSYVEFVGRDYVRLSQELPEDSPEVIIEYYGNSAVTFDTSAPYVSLEHEEDLDWTLDSINGEFKEYADVMADGVLNFSTRVSTTFVPANGETGLGYITAKFGNGFATQPISVIGSPSTIDISLTADPSSIPVSSESTLTAYVSQGGIPLLSGTVEFFIYHNANLGSLSSSSASIGTAEMIEEIISSQADINGQSTLTSSRPILNLTSIVDVNGVDYTADVDYIDPISGTTIYMKPNFILYEILVTLTYTYSGVAYITFYSGNEVTNPTGEDDDPVIVSASYGGRNKIADISITAADDAGADSLAITVIADPSHIDVNATSVVTVGGVPGIVNVALTHGKGTITQNGQSVSSVNMDVQTPYVETITPTDVTHVSVKYVVSSVTSITHYGSPVLVESFSGKDIVLAQALVDLEDVIVTYQGTQSATLLYTPQLDWSGEAHIAGTQVGAKPGSCDIIVGAGLDPTGWKIAVTADPEIINRNWHSHAVATVTGGVDKAEPVAGVDLIISLGPMEPATEAVGSLSEFVSLLTKNGTTDANGQYLFDYFSKTKLGKDVITATIDVPTDDGQSANCNIEVKSEAHNPRYTYELEMISATVRIKAGRSVEPLVDPYNISFLDPFWPEMDGPTSMTNLSSRPIVLDLFRPFLPIGYADFKWTFKISSTGESSSYTPGTVEVSGAAQVKDRNGTMIPLEEVETFNSSPMTSAYSFFIVPLPVGPNDNKTFVPVVVKGTSIPIQGAKGTINAQTVESDVNGILTFTDLPAGTHTVQITAEGFLSNNPPGTPDPTVRWSTLADTQTIDVAARGTGAYHVGSALFTIQGICTIRSDEYNEFATAGLNYRLLSFSDNVSPSTGKATSGEISSDGKAVTP